MSIFVIPLFTFIAGFCIGVFSYSVLVHLFEDSLHQIQIGEDNSEQSQTIIINNEDETDKEENHV